MNKILVVEDDMLMLEFVSDVLSKEGYQVLTAKDGLSALDILETFTPDAIFVDLIMPSIDGRKLCKIIRGMERLKHIYIIILSAVAAEEQVDIVELGADACIAKGPFHEMARHIVVVLDHPDAASSQFSSGEVIGAEDVYPREITGELLSVKRHFEAILESMSKGILEINSEGRIIYANSVARSFMNMDEKKLLGSHFDRVFSNGNRKRVCDLLKMLADTPRKMIEDTPVDLNGYQLTLNILPIHDENGSTAIIILTDVSERKRMEAIVDQAQKMEAMGTLAGGIVHDFNNLLMGIQGNVSLILTEIDPGHRLCDRLRIIEDYVQSGANLTNHLLGLARDQIHEVVPTNLNDLIKKSSSMFGRTKKEITIHRKYEKNIWVAETDPGQIEQVLLNLYVNAWQAMPSGGELYLETENVTLNEQCVKPYGVESGRYVKISVRDTGSGIDTKTMARIFEPFFTTKGRGKGTGLGLASAYRNIKNHGGFVTVCSEEGEGTTFEILLPASGKKAIEKKRPSEKLLVGKETILFVDDEEWVIDVWGQLLENMGYRSFTAGSGREAIDLYKKHWTEIDMVILDMIMPDMGGGETFEKLREINPGMKGLLSSGYGINGEASEILERGCKGFIQKPFNMKALSQKLRETLDNE